MTIENHTIELDQHTFVTKHRRTSPPEKRERGSLYSLLSLCAVLAACGASQTGEFEESLAPTNARTSSAALELSPASPVNPIPGVVQAEYQSAIVAGNGFYFVVWTGTSDILGVRINALDGTPLDASPIPIATGAAQQTAPAVAFDGTHFLVVWEQGAGNSETRGMTRAGRAPT